MKRVVGIGGIFIKSRNPEALKAWYRKHLGMEIQDWGGVKFEWNTDESSRTDGATIWSVFDDSSSNFAPSRAPFMVNYIVEDLHGILNALRTEGCDVDSKTEESEFGKFGWVMDPDGNRVELWEPPSDPMK